MPNAKPIMLHPWHALCTAGLKDREKELNYLESSRASSSPQSWLHHAFLWRLQGDGKPSGSNEAGSCCLRSTAMHAGQPDRITAYLKHFMTRRETVVNEQNTAVTLLKGIGRFDP